VRAPIPHPPTPRPPAPRPAPPAGWYLPELVHPFNEFQRAGWECDFASPEGGVAPLDPASVAAFDKDVECTTFLKGGPGSAMDATKATLRIDAVDFGGYDVVFFVGGHGPMWDLPNHRVLADKLAAFYASPTRRTLIGAVCHGVAGLVNVAVDGAPLLRGKHVTAFSDAEERSVGLAAAVPFCLEERLRERGAIYEKADKPWGETWGRGGGAAAGSFPTPTPPPHLPTVQARRWW
jgi:putative intracellular protease/amidase